VASMVSTCIISHRLNGQSSLIGSWTSQPIVEWTKRPESQCPIDCWNKFKNSEPLNHALSVTYTLTWDHRWWRCHPNTGNGYYSYLRNNSERLPPQRSGVSHTGWSVRGFSYQAILKNVRSRSGIRYPEFHPKIEQLSISRCFWHRSESLSTTSWCFGFPLVASFPCLAWSPLRFFFLLETQEISQANICGACGQSDRRRGYEMAQMPISPHLRCRHTT